MLRPLQWIALWLIACLASFISGYYLSERAVVYSPQALQEEIQEDIQQEYQQVTKLEGDSEIFKKHLPLLEDLRYLEILLVDQHHHPIVWTSEVPLSIDDLILSHSSKDSLFRVYLDEKLHVVKKYERGDQVLYTFLDARKALPGGVYPEDIDIAVTPNNYGIYTPEGEILFFLDIPEGWTWVKFLRWGNLFYFLSVLFLLIFVTLLTRQLFHRYRTPVAFSVSALLLLIIFISGIYLDIGAHINFFAETSYSHALQLLYQAVVVLLFAYLINLVKVPVDKVNITGWITGPLLIVLFFGTLLLGYHELNEYISLTGFEPGYQNITFNIAHILGYLFILTWAVTLFLFQLFIYNAFQATFSSLKERVAYIVAGSLLVLIVLTQLTDSFPIIGFLLIGISLALLWDVFLEDSHKRTSWVFIWITVTAGFFTTTVIKLSIDSQWNEHGIIYSQISEGQEVNNILAEEEGVHYSLYQNGVQKQTNSGHFSINYDYDTVPPASAAVQLRGEKSYTSLYSLGKDRVLALDTPRLSWLKPLSIFSLLFVLLILLCAALSYFNSIVQIFPASWNFRWAYETSLKNKMQRAFVGIIVISFICLCIFTLYYYRQNAPLQLEDAFNEKLNSYLSISRALAIEHLNPERNLEYLSDKLSLTAQQQQVDIAFYQLNGRKAFSPDEAAAYMSWPAMEAFQNGGKTFISDDKTHGYALLSDDNQRPLGYLNLKMQKMEDLQSEANTFLGALFNLYLFLMLMAATIAVLVSDSITKPLSELREKLKLIKLGKKNDPLEWKINDEIGELIADYNRMIDEIHKSAEMLAHTQREMAWREMAKQVAHEIKNPLTPMKLSLQHMQLALRRNNEDVHEMVDRMSQTLIEQIDNLTQIADEFSNFAKLPEPENEKINICSVVASAHDLFRKREDIDIFCTLPIEDIMVFADKNHCMRVLNNLLKNAVQAIPLDRKGKIHIKIKKSLEYVTIMIRDNGMGIPEDKKDKVFQPYFTSKSSGTGLGLAICANIVESMSGKLYFKSEENIGTTFYLQLPLMRVKENLTTEKRVIL